MVCGFTWISHAFKIQIHLYGFQNYKQNIINKTMC